MMSYDYPHPVSRTYQYKKITKPLLERKRRARINRCLDELKDLMVDALETEGENISKLEKADILELTVRHLQRLQASRPSGLSTVAIPGEDSSESRWRSGFGHCAAEACRFLTALPGEAADRLARHLATGLQSPRQLEVQVTTQKASNSSPAVSPTIQRPVDLVSPSLASLEKTANLLAPSLVIPSAGSQSPRQNLSPRETSHPYSAGKMTVIDRPPTAGSVSVVIKEPNIRPASCSVGKEATEEETGRKTVGAQAQLIISSGAQSIVPTTSKDQRIHDATKPHEIIIPDDDEEIDVENIDEGDPMWRPW